MANNQDALNAIVDIKEAIAEYGSSIKILTQTAGEWDSYGNIVIPEGTSEVITKALIGSSATDKLLTKLSGDILNSYSLSMRLYSSTEITKANTISFRGDEYEIVFIDEMILQDTTLIYEILVKK